MRTANAALAWSTALATLVAGAPEPVRGQAVAVPPPAPLLPIPTARQLEWQRGELALFLHFGVNTFTNREWGDGREDPAVFRPTALDARQWVRVARETGFRTVILTAKHHDGFTLWPSAYTEHSVRASPWRGGSGDVVRELVEAARAEGVRVGLYLSPWDQHAPTYGDGPAYNRFYLAQLRELLGNYGPLAEVWFDGAKGSDAPDMVYDFDAYWSLVRQMQPGAVMFSDAGPDVRWIGNERGVAGETNWSMYDRSRVQVGQSAGMRAYLNAGDSLGPHWVPGECDVSIRRGWFWHADQEPRSLKELLDIYFHSVGRNCVLLLNVPPDTTGRLPEADVRRLRELRGALDRIFAVDFAARRPAGANNVRGGSAAFSAARAVDGDLSTYWTTDDLVTTGTLEVDLGRAVTFNVVRIQEEIELGQRVAAYVVEVDTGEGWRPVTRGTTVGHKKLDRFPPVTARRVRLAIEPRLNAGCQYPADPPPARGSATPTHPRGVRMIPATSPL